MGSTSDWDTMKNAADILKDFGVEHECKVVSAHRTPDLLFEFAKTAEEKRCRSHHCRSGWCGTFARNVCFANRLAGLGCSGKKAVRYQEWISLLSIVQMPAGVPVGTLANRRCRSKKNAALFAISILANSRSDLRGQLRGFRESQTDTVLKSELK